MTKRTPFIWNEIEHWVLPDVMDTIQLVSDEEAADFMEAYSAVCGEQVAEHNIRYMLDILARRDRATAEEVSAVFMLAIPEPNETLIPLHTFGMSSYGVIEGKPVPEFVRAERLYRPSRAVQALSDAPMASESRPKRNKRNTKATSSSPAPRKKVTRVELSDEQASTFLGG